MTAGFIAVGSDNQWNLLCDILQIEKLTEWELQE